MEYENYIWNSTVEEIVMGYKENTDSYLCTLCGKEFEKGQIFTLKDKLYDAFGRVKEHHKTEHGSSVDYLLSMGASLIGISEVQQQILKLMSEGKEDKAIAQIVGIAQSTVRNHRFKLREKEKQAKLYLALMQSLEDKTKRSIKQADSGVIEEIHQSATMIDDRYNITDEDRNKTIKAYMNESGALNQFPAKEKKKIILLREIMKNFKHDQEYCEEEVNKILERIYSDYATIRRALIEYGFLDRSNDCSVYRVKE
jgi:DNA-binding CsgD family transcriptional regulator